MRHFFPTIGLIGKHTNPEVKGTLTSLITFLKSQSRHILVENHCAALLPEMGIKGVNKEELVSASDLVIVVGGDGSFLDAARAAVDKNVPLVGVNRGRRGFLTDLSPQALTQALEPILEGNFVEERRFFLEMSLCRQNKVIHQGIALNDIDLHTGDIAKMIDFQVFIDDQFVYRQRSDGVITATPTGSTAYALAGGGPILHPSLDAMVIVPMHPPMLSSRPIVIKSSSIIKLHVMAENIITPHLSCDGQIHFPLEGDDTIIIQRKQNELRLLHPTDYDYYHTLRSKLGWTT